MHVSATLIAAQQAAREARARLQVPEAQAAAKPDFAAALGDGFSSLPLKQTSAPSPAPARQATQPQARGGLGQHLDITV